MTPRQLRMIVLLVCVCAVLPAHAGGQAPVEQAIRWRTDYSGARKEAQEKSLPLVIDFGTTNCYWCKKLDESTLKESRVVTVLNERFIPLKIDAQREATLTQLLRITSYPTVVLAGPDGRILGMLEGFHEAEKFHDQLQRALSSLAPPDWIERELKSIGQWITAGDYARAIPSLRTITEEPKAQNVHAKARDLLKDIEAKAKERLTQAKQLQDAGKVSEAIESLTETMRLFPGLESSRIAAERLTHVVQNPEIRNQHRGKRARELLAQAKDYYQSKEYIPCLDRCEVLLASYSDLQEGQEASRLATEIKNNPEWLQGAADTMSDRLGGLYLALADSLLKRGQPQRAEFYLQRVLAAFPGSRQAESAQIRLSQLQGTTPRPNQVQSAGP